MAKKPLKKKAPIFLIMQDRQQCHDMADGVREAGYDVTEYQTGREFLIDKRHHTGGIVIAEVRLEPFSRISDRSGLFYPVGPSDLIR